MTADEREVVEGVLPGGCRLAATAVDVRLTAKDRLDAAILWLLFPFCRVEESDAVLEDADTAAKTFEFAVMAAPERADTW